MYKFKSKETEDAFMRLTNGLLSHHPSDTELFYEFIRSLCLGEDMFDVIPDISNPEKTTSEDTENIAGSNENLAEELQRFNIETQTLLKNIENSIQDFIYKDKINKELHEELQNYKAGLREEFVKPVLKTIIREYDRAVQLYEFYNQKAEAEQQSELFAKLLKEFNIVSLGFLDILYDYNFVPFEVCEGDEFVPREHKISKVISTNDISKDGKIAKCVKCGFQDTDRKRLLRQAEVNIYKIIDNK